MTMFMISTVLLFLSVFRGIMEGPYFCFNLLVGLATEGSLMILVKMLCSARKQHGLAGI